MYVYSRKGIEFPASESTKGTHNNISRLKELLRLSNKKVRKVEKENEEKCIIFTALFILNVSLHHRSE